MARLSHWYSRLLEALMLLACLLLLTMTLLIGADVLLRNIGLGGIAPSNELSEDIIYLLTLLAAPGLLRQGQHIRIDIVLRALPAQVGWLLEWISDILGVICCLYFVWYGTRVAVASFESGALSIKTLIIPEWWLLAPMPMAFVLLSIEFLFRMHRLALAERRPRDDAVSASWGNRYVLAARLAAASRRLHGASVHRPAGRLRVHGDQHRRGDLVSRRRCGPEPNAQEQRRGGDQFLADANSPLRADGRGSLPYRARPEGDRRNRAPGSSGPGTPRGRRGGRGHGVLGHLGLDHRDHRHAGVVDAAGHALARLQPGAGDGTDHGDRRGRHADPAVRAHRAARQPVRDFDFEAADRRRRSGPDAQRRVRRLHHRARDGESGAGAGDRGRGEIGMGAIRAARMLRAAARLDLCGGHRGHVGRHCHSDGVRRARGACHHGACRGLSRVELRRAAQSIAGHRRDFGDDPLHHPRRYDLLANLELFGVDRRYRFKHLGWRAHPLCDPRRNDAAVDLSRHFCRPGQHDAHYLAGVHADRAAPRYRSHLVWRSLSDLHAARPAAAAAWTSADDDEGRRAEGGHDGAHFSRGGALCRDEPRAARHHHHGSGDRDLAAERAGLTSPSGGGETALRQHRRCLDLEARLGLDQATDLDHRHGREMPAHDLAIGGAERGKVGEIFVHVAHIPGQADDVPRRGAGLRQHRGDVLERLLHLRHESRGEAALLVLADHAADEHHFTARADAVGETFRLRPAGGLQHGVGSAVIGRSADRAFGHCHLRVDASFVAIRIPSVRNL